MLKRDRRAPNKKRVQRMYSEVPFVANQCWSLDFVSDQVTGGGRFRILAVIVNYTRECLGFVRRPRLATMARS